MRSRRKIPNMDVNNPSSEHSAHYVGAGALSGGRTNENRPARRQHTPASRQTLYQCGSAPDVPGRPRRKTASSSYQTGLERRRQHRCSTARTVARRYHAYSTNMTVSNARRRVINGLRCRKVDEKRKRVCTSLSGRRQGDIQLTRPIHAWPDRQRAGGRNCKRVKFSDNAELLWPRARMNAMRRPQATCGQQDVRTTKRK